MKLSHIAFRNISRNRRRSLLCMAAISLAAMTIVLMFSMITGMRADLKWNVQAYFTGQIRIRNSEYDDKELLNPLHLRLQTWRNILDSLGRLNPEPETVARIPFPAFLDPPTVANPDGDNLTAMGTGVDFSAENMFQNLAEYLHQGRLPEPGKAEILLGSSLAEKLGKTVGDSITLLTTTMRRGPNAATFTITGLADFRVAAMQQSYFYIPLDRAQHILKMGNSVTEILIKFNPTVSDREAKAMVSSILSESDNASVRDWRELNMMVGWIDFAQILYDFMALIFFILASTVIINSIMMIIYERMREIGTIAAMGMQSGEIVRLFFLEAFFLALLGTAVGVLFGTGLTLILGITGIDFSSGMQGVDFDISNVIYPVLNFRSTVVVFFYSVAVASLSSLVPTLRAARIEPVDALRHT